MRHLSKIWVTRAKIDRQIMASVNMIFVLIVLLGKLLIMEAKRDIYGIFLLRVLLICILRV